jgi:adenylate kinase
VTTGLLGVTGTPGTGKKTLSPLIASRLSYSLLDLNSAVMHDSRSKPGTPLEVDTVRLRKRILANRASNRVIFGHLLPDVFRAKELDFVAVLRCEPSILKRRLVGRGYSGPKVIANIEAELIGVVLDASIRSFGKSLVHEYDSTKAEPARLARIIVSDYTRGIKAEDDWIDWTDRYTSSARLRSLFSLGSTEPAST